MVGEEIRRQNQPNYGLDVLREQYVDLVEAGIIDPAKVARSARKCRQCGGHDP